MSLPEWKVRTPTDEEVMLSKEFVPSSFPFRGKPDFRGFTDEDYAHFSGGVFFKTDDPKQFRWLGGSAIVESVRQRLVELGYAPLDCKIGHFCVLLFDAKEQ